jgi:hypothetical protein
MMSENKISELSRDAAISNYLISFEQAMAAGQTWLANRVAMLAAEHLLKSDAEAMRPLLWQHMFSKLAARFYAQYQSFDFEIVDYEMYPATGKAQLFRGPVPALNDLAGGRYITFLGAAQLFGRYQKVGPHTLVAEQFGLAGVNLSMGGAGPEAFIRDEFVEIANGGQAAVLQVLSGRSIGCDEYPDGRRTFRAGSGDKSARIARLTILRDIWKESRPEAMRLVGKWQRRYVDVMSALVQRIRVPVIFVWVSVRPPDAWSIDRLKKKADFGLFPHLVDREMVTEISKKCGGYVEISQDAGLPYSFASRVTGEPCPRISERGEQFWENNYYPSREAGLDISSQIVTALGTALPGRQIPAKKRKREKLQAASEVSQGERGDGPSAIATAE